MDIFRKVPNEQRTDAEQMLIKGDYIACAESIYERHFRQSVEDVGSLSNKYSAPVVGTMKVFEAFLLLGQCIDPSDTELFCTNQLTHSLQVAEAMECDGLDRRFILAGLIHDIGKILLLFGEDPANVTCPNEPIGDYVDEVGLDRIIVQWNHDEYIYHKLYPYLDEEIAWLLRYHSLRFDKAERYMSPKDWERKYNYLDVFRHYDLYTKSPFLVPSKSPYDYKDLLDSVFPNAISF